MITTKKLSKALSFLVTVVFVISSLQIVAFARSYVTTEEPTAVSTTYATFHGTYSVTGSTAIPDEVGFAYSLEEDDDNPEMERASMKKDFSVKVTGLSSNDTYYVRAYIAYEDDDGELDYTFGDEISFKTESTGTTSTSSTNVTTKSAEYDKGYIYAEASIKSAIKDDVKEVGFVYSPDITKPTLSDDYTKSSLSGLLFEKEFLIDVEHTTYYVRAYAKTKTSTIYGNVVKLTFKDSLSTMKNFTVGNIGESNAEFAYTISNIGDSDIIRSGIVFSETASTPTIGKSGCFYQTATNPKLNREIVVYTERLTPNMAYYARAFVENAAGIAYTDVKTFTTKDNGVVVNISLETNGGLVLGNQKIQTRIGNEILTTDIIIPTGYRLSDPTWKYSVIGNRNIVVYITENETEYFRGLGNYTFGPTIPASRAQVAQILYDLAADKTFQVSSTYTDVSPAHPNKQAIDYVTYKGYMRGSDGRFNPDSSMTRAEFATTLYFYYQLTGEYVPLFNDCKDHWAKQYISVVSQRGIMAGDGGVLFSPQSDITRAQVCITFGRALSRTLAPLSNLSFIDVYPNTNGYEYIMNASIPTP